MIYCIANPTSRSGLGRDSEQKLKDLLTRRQIPFSFHYTTGRGDAGALAAEFSSRAKASGEDASIVVLGGDGTVNEVINGITDFSAVRLGIVPVGSANDFVRGIRLPSGTDELLERIAAQKVRRKIDLGRVRYDSIPGIYARGREPFAEKTHLFAVSAGIGFDAAVCEEIEATDAKSRMNRLHIGGLTYSAVAIRKLASMRKVACDITTDDGRELHFDRIIFSVAMNLAYEGGGYCFAPDAIENDGLLNILIAGDIPKIRALVSLPAAHRGKHYDIPGIRHFPCREIRIRTDVPLWVHTDGEVLMQTDAVTFTCLPETLALIV